MPGAAYADAMLMITSMSLPLRRYADADNKRYATLYSCRAWLHKAYYAPLLLLLPPR